MFSSWNRLLRRQELRAQPFPAAWFPYIEHSLADYLILSGQEKARLQQWVQVFVAEKNWEGCRGLEITEEIRVTIAAQAGITVLAFTDEYFDRVPTILVYPDAFLTPVEYLGTSVIYDAEHAACGQASYRGPVVLSWKDVLRSVKDPGRGRNVVYHEFAHQLDMLDGSVNGTPPLDDDAQAREWRDVMFEEFRQLRDRLQGGKRTFLDPYAATNEGEFFAVASEYFFDCPLELARAHPRLYQVLTRFYRQDPAARRGHKGQRRSYRSDNE